MRTYSLYVETEMYHIVESSNKNFKFFINHVENHWVCIVERIGEYYDLENEIDFKYFMKDEVD
jgi:hypothetical protein